MFQNVSPWLPLMMSSEAASLDGAHTMYRASFLLLNFYSLQIFEFLTPDLDHVGQQTVKSTYNSILCLLQRFSMKL